LIADWIVDKIHTALTMSSDAKHKYTNKTSLRNDHDWNHSSFFSMIFTCT